MDLCQGEGAGLNINNSRDQLLFTSIRHNPNFDRPDAFPDAKNKFQSTEETVCHKTPGKDIGRHSCNSCY